MSELVTWERLVEAFGCEQMLNDAILDMLCKHPPPAGISRFKMSLDFPDGSEIHCYMQVQKSQ